MWGALKGPRDEESAGQLVGTLSSQRGAASPFEVVLCGDLSSGLGSNPPCGADASTPGLFHLSVYFSWLLTPSVWAGGMWGGLNILST